MSAGPQTGLVTLNAAEIAAAIAGRRCAVCGEAKRAGDAFCRTDYLALPLHLRTWLSQREPAYFVENFNRALNHLRLNPRRAARFLGDGSRWPYPTVADLERAGYQYVEIANCRVPGCWREIAWYRGPGGQMLAIDVPARRAHVDDPIPCTPHARSCKDPEYFARRRQQRLRASAGKSQRRRNA